MEFFDLAMSNAEFCIRPKPQIGPAEFQLGGNTPMTKVDIVEDFQKEGEKNLMSTGVKGGWHVYSIERQ
jgi:hypothetical protein